MKNSKWNILLLLLLISIVFIVYIKKESITTADNKVITAELAKQMIDTNSNLTILDVRTLDEYNSGHIKDAILLPYDEVPEKSKQLLPDKDTVILVYCRSGRRSALAAQSLSELGYSKVYDFGGILDWKYGIE